MRGPVSWLLAFPVLLALCFNSDWTGWLCFVVLVPLFIFVEKARKLHWHNSKIVKYAWLAGLASSLVYLFWLALLQLEIVPTAISSQFILIKVFIWIITSLIASVGVLFVIYLITKLKLNLTKPSAILYIPAAWVFGELLRATLCSIIWWSPQATVGPLWNFGALGIAAATTPLGYLSRLVGLYGLSFVVVMINIMIYWLWRKRNQRLTAIICSAIVILNIGAYAIYSQANGRRINVGFMQLKEFKQLDTETLRSKIDSSNQKTTYDVFVLPEYSMYFKNPSGNIQTDVFDKLFDKKPGVLISAGGQDIYKNKNTSQIVYRNQNNKVVSVQEKNFLMPIGEYVPTGAELVLKAVGKGNIVKTYEQNRKILLKGAAPEKPVIYNGIAYGTLSCSGSLTPQPYQKLTHQGASILISSSSLGTLDQSTLFNRQAEQIIKLTATATARPYVQSSKGGFSYIVDHNGKIVVRNWADSPELIHARLQTNTKKTPYALIGDLGIPISLAILVYLGLTKYSKSQRKTTER